MHTKTVLLLDSVHPEFPVMLEEIGLKTEILNSVSEHELQKIIEKYYGLVIRNSPAINSEIIDAGKNLRFIARAGSGIEHIDYAYAKKKGIEVFHSPEGNSSAVGEHALGLTICLLKKIVSASMEVKQGLWERESNRGSELAGKTVGIIGYGNTGSAFAKKLSGMNVEIIAYDKYKSGFSNQYLREVSLNELMLISDIVSFHVPLTAETIHYADDVFFQNCKKQILLLNTSRGKVVSTTALVNALKSGKVVAAGLDVIEKETSDFQIQNKDFCEQYRFLLTLPEVIITPHIAGITHEAQLNHAVVLAMKIRQLEHSSQN
jgi:D-3-phosphoglycerate dehydrogenase / 2-oxoglutarate reductase